MSSVSRALPPAPSPRSQVQAQSTVPPPLPPRTQPPARAPLSAPQSPQQRAKEAEGSSSKSGSSKHKHHGKHHHHHHHHHHSSKKKKHHRHERKLLAPVVDCGESLLSIMRRIDPSASDALIATLKELNELKRRIAVCSKKTFQLEGDIGALDKKISLLIKNRITLDEVLATKGAAVMATAQDGSAAAGMGQQLKDRSASAFYGRLFYLLQRNTLYISRLARVIRLADMDNFLQTVMFTLYGNQYEEDEEHLLLTMFQSVLAADFAEAKGLGDLLRANTALTRMMNTYTRRGPGQQYLKATLAEPLTRIADDAQLNLEINPSKVLEQYINDFETREGRPYEGERKPTAEACAELPFIKEIIQPRYAQIEAATRMLIDALRRSVETAPFGIRWICRQIKQLLLGRWPESTRQQVCSVVGGFFILRFLNPAIATPNAYMLVENKLSNTARRNVTLLAKVMQNLANNTPFGGLKELYMAPLNPLLEKYYAEVDDILEQLTDVDDLDVHLDMDRYIALTKFSDQTIAISLNEMYFVHALLLANKDAVFAGLTNDEVQQLIESAPDAPAQLPRKENTNVELKLVSVRKGGEGKDDVSGVAPEQKYSETKYLFFALMRVVPLKQVELTNGDVRQLLGQLAAWATTHSKHDTLDLISNILANCKELTAMGVLSTSDNYARLRNDLAEDVTNVTARIKRAASEAERLRSVLQTIMQRYDVAVQQLKVYEEYLTNVRSTATMASGSDKGSKKQASAAAQASAAKPPPVKHTYTQLLKSGVIKTSQIPEDKQPHIIFEISVASPGTFEISVMYRSHEFATMKLVLDDLLERQATQELDFETDFITLNINLLIHLLNNAFVAKNKK